MATIYLRSSDGNDSDDGSTWALAKATMQAALTAAGAGGTVYMDDDHNESFSTAVTITSPGTINNPTKVICVVTDTTTPVSNYGATANYQSTTSTDYFRFDGSAYYYGINFEPFDGVFFGDGELNIFEKCLIYDPISDGSGSNIRGDTDAATAVFIDTDLKDASLQSGVGVRVEWRGGSWLLNNGSPGHLIYNAGEGGIIHIEGVDLSAWNGSLSLIQESLFESHINKVVSILNCKLPSGVTITDTDQNFLSPDGFIKVHASGNADEYYQFYEFNYAGTIEDSTAIDRVGGETYDGTNLFSAKMTTNTQSEEYFLPLRFKLKSFPVDATSGATLKVHIAYDDATALNDDDIWIECKYHDSTDQALGKWERTKPATMITTPGRTPFTDVSGSETWNGTGAWTNEKNETIEATFTGGNGLVDVYVCLAKPSQTVYVCPKVEVS